MGDGGRPGGLVAVIAVAALLVVGCAGSSTGSDDAGGPTATSSSVATPAPTTTPSPTDAPAEPRPPALAGLGGEVTLTTPESGAGERPLLAWEAVDGAVTYTVTVSNENGTPYWAWDTDATEVLLGLTTRPPAAPGPRIGDGMTWWVVAVDADGRPIASSPRRPIST